MKKLIVIALAVVMALSMVAVLAACDSGETYNGTCSYTSEHGTYGVEVNVTVKGDRITKVELVDHEGWTRTTAIWGHGEGQMSYNEADLGYEATEAAYAGWFKKVLVGKTVAEVMAYQASATADGQTVTTESVNLVGATQSAARVIVAVQNALSKIAK